MFTVIVLLAAATEKATPQDTPQVTPQVLSVLRALSGEPITREQIQEMGGIKDREHLRTAYSEPLLAVGWIERTIPDKPTSRLQKYRLTKNGRACIDENAQ